MISKKLFEYKYEVCWGPRSIVTVLDTEKENLICTKYPQMIGDPIIYKLELKESKIDSLKKLIHNHQKIFSICEIESNCVCDGCSSDFFISDGCKTIELFCSNLWYFDHDEMNGKPLKGIRKVSDGQEIINAKILLEFFYDVKDFLNKSGVPNSYFKY